MDITIKIAQEDIADILKEHLRKQFPEVQFKVTHPYYCQEWTLESVDPIQEAKREKILADYRASLPQPEPSLQPDNNAELQVNDAL